MLPLAELQARLRQSIIGDDVAAILPMLTGVPVPSLRLDIYRRHYRESLVRHLLRRFPTVEWLLGSSRLADLAGDYCAERPPVAPCIAEYGRGFADFLEGRQTAAGPAYLHEVAELDWRLGNAAIAIDSVPLSVQDLGTLPPMDLPDLRLQLQPGVSYLQSARPVDDLVRLRLAATIPAASSFGALKVYLELTGARGSFTMTRLTPPVFAFREALQQCRSIGVAVDRALSLDPHFDPGGALVALFHAGLVTAALPPA